MSVSLIGKRVRILVVSPEYEILMLWFVYDSTLCKSFLITLSFFGQKGIFICTFDLSSKNPGGIKSSFLGPENSLKLIHHESNGGNQHRRI